MYLPPVFESPRDTNVVVHEILEILEAFPESIVQVLDFVVSFCLGLMVGSFSLVIREVKPGGGGIFSSVGGNIEK